MDLEQLKRLASAGLQSITTHDSDRTGQTSSSNMAAQNGDAAIAVAPAVAPATLAAINTATSPKQASEEPGFSWLDPHVLFVVILIGPEQTPFGIQKDFLSSKSSFFRNMFEKDGGEQATKLEQVVNLPETTPEVFGLAQNFLYTGRVFSESNSLPGYDILIATWKLGNHLGIDSLCDEAIEAMKECRRITQHIPATPLLIQVWNDTPEGSVLRKLLLTWAAEYIRSSESRTEFCKSLPQRILSELVVEISQLDSSAPVPVAEPLVHPQHPTHGNTLPIRKNGQVVEADEEGEEDEEDSKENALKRRHSDAGLARPAPADRKVSTGARKGTNARASLPGASKMAGKPGRPGRKRLGAGQADQTFTSKQKLKFCADLLARMLSGPGFWTRIVGPFKEPVDPVTDGVPDYLQVIKNPMDLSTIKGKMARNEYANENEFLADMRQIFTNCFTYWTPEHPIWATCEKLQKTFEDRYGAMNKWLIKMELGEAASP